jgi:hypothetical protein
LEYLVAVLGIAITRVGVDGGRAPGIVIPVAVGYFYCEKRADTLEDVHRRFTAELAESAEYLERRKRRDI